jgi:alanyl-tRNA synthetase
VRRCTKIRQDWRVEFACGNRAEKLSNADFQLLRSIGDRLSCSPEEAPAAIEKSIAERDANSKILRIALQQLAEARAKVLADTTPRTANGLRCITLLLKDENTELLLPLATDLAKNENTVALLVHESTGQLVFSQSMAAAADLNAILKQLLGNFPGKGGGTRDFVRAKLSDPSQSAAALKFATELISA